LVFSSIAELTFGFGFLILKQTSLEVLLGFTAMIEIEKQIFTEVCYIQGGAFLARAYFSL
jgi:hypothetical protein